MTENEQIKNRLVEIAQKELNNCARFDTFGGTVYYPVSVQFLQGIGEQLAQEGYSKVERGEWIAKNGYQVCPICNNDRLLDVNFCSVCGSDMRGEN